jgi:hypothetical protein
MSRKQQIEAAFREAQRQYEAGELPLPDENDPTESWPLHKYCVWLFNDPDGGPELLEVFCEHRGIIKFEELVDTAAELERRHFPHVAAVLRKVAENAKSEVDDCIERDEAERLRRQRNGHRDRGYWHLSQWLHGRVRITGQSWNELVRFYGLDESPWAALRDRDLICEDGKWREFPATNGAERVH